LPKLSLCSSVASRLLPCWPRGARCMLCRSRRGLLPPAPRHRRLRPTRLLLILSTRAPPLLTTPPT
jgi:hypothetical protein